MRFRIGFMKPAPPILMHRVRLLCLLVLLPLAFAQEASFHITPLRPVEEIRAEALKAQPPREQGKFRKPDRVELVKLNPTNNPHIRNAPTNTLLSRPHATAPRTSLQ